MTEKSTPNIELAKIYGCKPKQCDWVWDTPIGDKEMSANKARRMAVDKYMEL